MPDSLGLQWKIIETGTGAGRSHRQFSDFIPMATCSYAPNAEALGSSVHEDGHKDSGKALPFKDGEGGVDLVDLSSQVALSSYLIVTLIAVSSFNWNSCHPIVC